MNKRYLDGIVLGLTLGFIASTVIYWLLDGTTGVVKQYLPQQITHIVTLVAAVIAVWGISNQIQSNIVLAERARLAKLDAARSSLPIVLSNIVQLCEERFHAVVNGNLEQPAGVHWQITDFELSTLKDCIEHADGIEKNLMQQIIRIYQVLISRWDDLEVVKISDSPTLENNNPETFIMLEQFYTITNWISLKSICNALFNYSRGTDSNPSKDEMRKATFSSLQHLCSGSRHSKGGWLLTNNKNYSDYLDRLIEKNHVIFIDGNWR
jgi:CHASE3 domain sensor protein